VSSKLANKFKSAKDLLEMDLFIRSLKVRYEEGPSGWRTIDPIVPPLYEGLARQYVSFMKSFVEVGLERGLKAAVFGVFGYREEIPVEGTEPDDDGDEDQQCESDC
jgi:hypothetical protein